MIENAFNEGDEEASGPDHETTGEGGHPDIETGGRPSRDPGDHHLDSDRGQRADRASGDAAAETLSGRATGDRDFESWRDADFKSGDARNACSLDERGDAAWRELLGGGYTRSKQGEFCAIGDAPEKRGETERTKTWFQERCDSITDNGSITREMDKDAFSPFAAARDLCRNYQEMLDFNDYCRSLGGSAAPDEADKYSHCKGMCEGSQRGVGGALTALALGDAREAMQLADKALAATKQALRDGDLKKASDKVADAIADSRADREANWYGVFGTGAERCETACFTSLRRCVFK